MAAISSAQPVATTLTPPSSSHGEERSWAFVGNPLRDPVAGKANNSEPPFDPTTTTSQFDFPQTGDPRPSLPPSLASHFSSKPTHDRLVCEHDDDGDTRDTRSPTKTPNSPPSAASDRRASTQQTSALGHRKHDDNSKWIHRDKLAKIESEELQAAGIFAPKPRAAGRHRRDRSHSRVRRSVDAADLGAAVPPSNGEPSLQEPKSPTNTAAMASPSWDLRTPEEVAEHDGNAYFARNESKGGSRIPVAKASHVPLPLDYLERGAPAERRRNVSSTEGGRAPSSIPFPKPRSRSASVALSDPSDTAAPPHADGNRTTRDGSPTRHAGRKPSSSIKASTSLSRPKTRTGAAARDVSTTTTNTANTVRPTTRGGLEPFPASKQPPEGDPPWLLNSYKPDPRLPPDQQLLPTVAKRLQQEKWEREGRFGDAYDKDFRPLNDNDFLKPPEREVSIPSEAEEHRDQPQAKEWPLRTAAATAAAAAAAAAAVAAATATTNRSLAPRQGSYSTMPKIPDKPPVSPVNGPRTPVTQTPPAPVTAPPTLESSRHDAGPGPGLGGGAVEKEGCACCLVM